MLSPQVSLHELGLHHGTDKAWGHQYTHRYAELFESVRNRSLRVLELGVKDGASLRMWRDYFPKAVVAGLDINATSVEGCTIFVGDQADPEVIGNLVTNCGPFDIIIDDASHLSSKTIASFEMLWPALQPGGYYCIEDTHSSYHAHYYGVEEANENPNGPTLFGEPTLMQYLRNLVDEVNYHGDGEQDLYPARYWKGYRIASLCFSFNLAIIRKSP